MDHGSAGDEAIAIFCGITGASQAEATRFLLLAHGDLNSAVSLFYTYEDNVQSHQRSGITSAKSSKESLKATGKHGTGDDGESSSYSKVSGSYSDDSSYSAESVDNGTDKGLSGFYNAQTNEGVHTAHTAQSQSVRVRANTNNRVGSNIVGFSDLQDAHPSAQLDGQSHLMETRHKHKQKHTSKKPLFVKKTTGPIMLKLKSLLVGVDLRKQLNIVTLLNEQVPQSYREATALASTHHQLLLIFVHAPGNKKSGDMLKLLQDSDIAKFIRKHFVFYATTIYHDEFQELISINVTTSSSLSSVNDSRSIMGTITNISGDQREIQTDGFVEYPYFGIVMPFGVDGVQKPKRINNTLLNSKKAILSTLQQIAGFDGTARTPGNEPTTKPKPTVFGETSFLDQSDSDVDDSDKNTIASTGPTLVELKGEQFNREKNGATDIQPVPQSASISNADTPEKAIPIPNMAGSESTDKKYEYVLRNAFGKMEVVTMSSTATVGELMDAALHFAQTHGDESITRDRLSVVCRNPNLEITSTSDMSSPVSSLLPDKSSLIVIIKSA